MNRTILICALAAFAAGCGDSGEKAARKGDAAAQANDPAAAAKFYAESADKGVTNRSLFVKLAVASAAAGDVKAATKAAADALEADASSAEAKLAAGHAAYLAKDYPGARAAFMAVANTTDLPAAMRAQALASAAVADIADDRFDSARVGLWRALRLDRRSMAAWYHLGYLSRNAWHFDEAAVEQFEMAGRLAGTDARARDIQRNVIPALRETLRARAANKKGVSTRNPKAAALLVTEGERALSKQKRKVALSKFEAAYAKDPLSYAAAWNYAKLLAQGNGNAAHVIAVFTDAADAKPTSQTVYRTAAEYALRRGRGADAERFLSRALAHDPEDKTTLEQFVRVLGANGKPKTAALYKAWMKEL